MLYIIGLGLNEEGISIEGRKILKKCKTVYLENYTVYFPYKITKLEKVLGKKVVELERGDVESGKLINESKDSDVCLLVYGGPLFATTHMSLINDAKKEGIKTKVIYAASVFDAIAETGLQLYKFGKISSMPTWQKNYEPDSFLDFVKQNQKIKAHSLILIDIGLELEKALDQLEKAAKKQKVKIGKMVVCSNLGTDSSAIYYGKISELEKKDIADPYCFIIPGELHFMEKDVLENI